MTLLKRCAVLMLLLVASASHAPPASAETFPVVWGGGTGITQGKFVLNASYDSSQAIPTDKYRNLAMTFFFTPVDTVASVNGPRLFVFAVQVRGHTSALKNTADDSTTTFPWKRWRAASGTPPTTAASDTLGGALFPDTMVTSLLGQDEFPVMLDLRGQAPRGRWISLSDPRSGQAWVAPYTSVRVRLIKVYGFSFASLAFGRSLLTCNLVGWN